MLTLLRTDDYVVAEDKRINQLATKLHTKLLAQWELDTAEYRAYGRCYRNPAKDGNGFIAEVYKGGSGKEYIEVAANDKVTCTSFFGVGESVKTGGITEVPVHLIFSVNLKRLWGDLDYRADADARLDVHNIVHNSFGFEVQGIKTGIDNVYAEYNSPVLRQKLKAKDMQPYHVFRIDFMLRYQRNGDCVKKKPRPTVRIFADEFADEFE